MKITALIFLMLSTVCSFGQKWSDHSFIEAHQRYDRAIPTTKVKIDSIHRYSHSGIHNLPLDELHATDSLFNLEIENANSLQSEFYWNVEYSVFLKANNLIGKTILVLNRNLEIAHELNDTLKILDANRAIAYFYYGNDMYDEALEFMWKTSDAVNLIVDSATKGNHFGSLSWQLTNIAYTTRDNALQDSAIKYSLLAHSMVNPYLEPSTFKERSFVAALCLARGGKRKECISFSLDCLTKVDSSTGLAGRLYPLIQEQYIVLNNKDSAYIYGDMLVDWDLIFDPPQQTIIETEDGRKVEAYDIANTIRAYTKFQDYSKATFLIDQVLFQDSLPKDQGLVNYYRELGVPAYEGTGEIGKALICQKLLHAYTDSIYMKNSESELKSHRELLEASIFLEKKSAEKVTKQQNELLKSQAANERLQFWFFSAGFVGLIIFLIILNSRFRKTKAQKRIIEEQKIRVEEAHEEIQDSIAYAKRIQTAILPPPKLVKEYLTSSFVLYKPKDIVAGDFYWMEPQQNGVLFAAADCTGHGVPGAMVSVICNNGLNRATREFGLSKPEEILTKTRELVIAEFEKSEEEVKDGMDIALCSLNGLTLRYAGAHNPLWIIRKDGTEVEEIKADKQPIGKYAEEKPFTGHEVQLNEGDTFYVFSDGFADQFGGEKGKKFKAKNFKALLLSMQSETMEKQKELIDTSFENWRGNLEQLDDVCVIGVRI